MNSKDLEALDKQAQLNYACSCAKKTIKPTAFVCVKCGKCYHKTCLSKIKSVYHLIGNLICCCETETELKYFEQEIATLNKEILNLKDQLLEERMKVKNYSNQSFSLLEEINDLHKKKNENQELIITKQELNYALEKIKNLNNDNTKLLVANDTLKIQNNDLINQIKCKEIEKCNTNIYEEQIMSLKEIIDTKNEICDSLKTNLKNINSSFATENNLLKDLNNSLQLNNKLQSEKIINLEQIIKSINNKNFDQNSTKQTSNSSYADILSNKVNNNNNDNHKFIINTPSLIISSKEKLLVDDTYNLIKSKIQTEIIMPVTNLKKNHKNNTVSFKCCNNDDIENTKENLSKILGSNYIVEVEQLANPKIKIVGISDNMCLQEIEDDINVRNFQDYNIKCKIIHIYKTKKNTSSAIIDIPLELYMHVRNNNYLVFIGAQRCHAYDYFDLLPCKNCGRVGHSHKKCTNETSCILCT